jgi:hypothetical protein
MAFYDSVGLLYDGGVGYDVGSSPLPQRKRIFQNDPAAKTVW